MNDIGQLWTLVWTFALMSLFAVGGANSAIPEMHRLAVDVHHWMNDKQFADVFAISQLSPGPPWSRPWRCAGRPRSLRTM